MSRAGGRHPKPFRHARGQQRHAAWAEATDICRDYLSGSSQTDLAQQYGCSADTIHDILVGNNVAITKRGRGVAGRAIHVSASAYDPPRPEAQWVDRDGCERCGTRRDIGCRHQRALAPWGVEVGLGHQGEVVTA